MKIITSRKDKVWRCSNCKKNKAEYLVYQRQLHSETRFAFDPYCAECVEKYIGAGYVRRAEVVDRAPEEVPLTRLTVGLEVKRCDECERGDCTKCDYKQEYERLMALPNCNNCRERIRGRCGYAPRVGEVVRINCPLWVPENEADKAEE